MRSRRISAGNIICAHDALVYRNEQCGYFQPEQSSATQSEKHSVNDGKSELLQSMFAGATVHIQNFNLHMK